MERIEAKSVEAAANYEGNASALLFERVKNPVIRAQIIGLLSKSEESKAGTTIRVWQTDAAGSFLKNAKGESFTEEVLYKPLSREELEKEFDETLARIESSTEVSFDPNPHLLSSSDVMQMNSIAPWSGKPFDERQMSLIEAHEKGHSIRTYDSPFFETYFGGAFRFDPARLTKEDVEMFRKGLDEDDKKKPDEDVKGIYIDYMSDAREIAERMSQLKNYFGMGGEDAFTREHLEYAREHYVADTGLDNGMRVFFEAIAPETEGEFLRLINCSGI